MLEVGVHEDLGEVVAFIQDSFLGGEVFQEVFSGEVKSLPEFWSVDMSFCGEDFLPF